MKLLTASTAGSWVQCPAFQASNVKHDSDAAREGVAAAWLADCVLNSQDGITTADYLGETAPNGHDITPDMVEYVGEYVSYVICESGGRGFQSEQTFTHGALNLTGRVDTLIRLSDYHIHIIDFKYGYRIIEPDAWQFIAYGLLCTVAFPDIREYQFTVYQPRATHPQGSIRTVTYSREQFNQIARELIQAAERCHKTPDLAVPCSACTECAKKYNCHALSKNLYAGHDIITYDGPNRQLTNIELSREAEYISRLLKMVEDRHTGIMAEIDSRLEKHEYIPGWCRVPKISNRYVNVDAATVELFTGCKATKEVNKTITDLQKEGVSKTVIDAITTTRINGIKTEKFSKTKIRKLFNE